MRNIEDLEHFVLAEGETLILRCTRHFSHDQLVQMRATIERYLPGRPVLILPPEIEVCAGRLEVFGVDMGSEEESAAAAEQVRRRHIEKAYYDGKMVWVRDGVEIFTIHSVTNPQVFDWDKYQYGLTRKDVCD